MTEWNIPWYTSYNMIDIELLEYFETNSRKDRDDPIPSRRRLVDDVVDVEWGNSIYSNLIYSTVHF